MTTLMTAETAALLREPFDPKHVGKLPRVFCKACRDAQFKVCQQHTKRKCRDCGNNITDAHLHLDYVGHAEITDRLLHADPTWTWEPVAFGPDGLPLRDQAGGLWIRLTVAGVSRLGYGHADGKPGPDAVKEAIGDALRNAAMRFGVALDLWGATFKDGGEDQPDEPQPDPAPDARLNILANAEAAIDAAPVGGLAGIEERVAQYVNRGSLTPGDGVALGRRVKARMELLAANQSASLPVEDRTAEPAEDPEVYYHGPDPAPVARSAVESTQQPMGADWPEPARPGNPT